MAEEGARLVLADRDAMAGEQAAERIRRAGGEAVAVAADVTLDADLDRLVETTLGTHGRIDILHSHAGIQVEGALEQVTPSGMDDSWRVNVRAHFYLARLVVPVMKRQGGGSIIVTSSNSGVFYDHEMIAYATSKHAVIAMVRQAAIDYGRHNIRINALCPGWVDTPFNDPFMRQMGGRDALLEYVRDKIPMGRFATVEEIAESILYLASDRSSFMTGHALVIDGGECIA
jgi:NAD(P)-dependent dehydrogenase (short-subunit alcohol dehydrogenase family)